MKKTNFLLVIATSCVLLFSFTQMKDKPGYSHQGDGSDNGNSMQVITSSQLNANNISTWYRNNGSLNRHPTIGNAGFEWPKGSVLFARSASGLWIGAVCGNDTLMAIAAYYY